MSDTSNIEGGQGGATREQMLFAHLVMQQANMALMLMGKVPHPETGQVVKDLEAARLFIDQLEMLEAKTKGNLTPEEAGLLKHSLMSVHLAFVEAVEKPEPAKPEGEPAAKPQPAPADTAAPSDESHKKFTKKY
jgi:hypothetical protein